MSAVEPIVRRGIVFLKHFEGCTGGIAARRDKPSTDRCQWPIELARNTVGIAESHIGTPLRAIAGDVHQGEASEERKGYVVIFGTVHAEADLQDRRRVSFLMHGDDESILTVAH